MNTWRSVRLMIVRSSMILSLIILSACAVLSPATPEPVATTEPEPEPDVVVTPEPEPSVEPEPEIAPEPAPLVEAKPENIRPLVAVVITDRNPAYVGVADALQEFLEHHEVYDLSDRSMAADAAFAAISESNAKAVVAVGLSAAVAARRYSSVPVVIGQVFNLGAANLLAENVRAVGVLPPIDLQIDAWQKLDPTLSDVGAILGPGHEDLIAQTDQALTERGLSFHYAIAETDREALYLFNRLVRDIDGYVLFPDNRILSRDVLTEMMRYATRHRVQISVFNEPLLEYGAAFNAGTVFSDIASTIAGVLDQILDGDIDHVPPVTALSDIEIQINATVLKKLGLIPNNTKFDNTVAGVP